MKTFRFLFMAMLLAGLLVLPACATSAEQSSGQAPVQSTQAEEPAAEETAVEEAPAVSEEDEKYGGVLTMGAAAVKQFDPAFTTDDPSFHVISLVHVFLFHNVNNLDGIVETVPELAKSWEYQEDGKVVIFHLNEGWTFHDGNEVFPEGQGREITAADVVYSIERMVTIEGGTPPGDLKDNFVSVEAVDKYTVKLTLKQPNAILFANGRGLSYTAILPKEAVEQLGEEWGMKPIGGGPFEFVEYVPDDHVTLQRNEDYHIKPYLDGVEMKIIPDAAVQTISMEAGELQVMDLQATDFEQFSADPDYSVYLLGCSVPVHMTFVQSKFEPFQDVQVRKALAHAIDGQSIMRTIYGGQFIEGCGTASEGVPGYVSDLCEKYFTYDPALSEQIMTEAGWAKNGDGVWEKDGVVMTFEVETWNTTPAPDLLAAAITQWRESGFDAQPLVVEFGTWIDDAVQGNGKPVMAWTGFCGEGGLNNLWGRGGFAGGFDFENEDVYALLEQANVTVDPAQRDELLQQATNLIYGDYVEIPLGFYGIFEVASNNVQDYRGKMWFANLVTEVNNVWLLEK